MKNLDLAYLPVEQISLNDDILSIVLFPYPSEKDNLGIKKDSLENNGSLIPALAF